MLEEYREILTPTQVAEILSVNIKTVYKLIHDGELNHIKIGRGFRISKQSLIDFISAKPFN